VAAPASPSAAPQRPTLELPTEAPAPAPPLAPQETAAQPVAEQAPRTPAAASRAAPARNAAERLPVVRTAAARRSITPQPRPTAPQVAEPAVAQAVSPMPPAASVPLTQSAVPPPAPAVRAASGPGGIGPGVWIAGLIVLLGAGAATFFATRARRRRDDEVYDDVYETTPSQIYTAPEPMLAGEPTGGLVPEAPLPAFTMIEDADIAHATAAPEPARAMIGTEERVPATAPAAAEGPAFVMPAGPVPRGEARDALLKQMADAAPDAQNPFHARKARLRRARLILQHLEHQQEQAAIQPFDWRTYKPSTSHPAPATPPRVTV
jgi:hypothetical protein